MPRLSIVIPWIGSAQSFEDTLTAVLQHRPGGCEVLVALSEPYDDPYGLGDEVTFLPPAGDGRNLVALANRGVAAATAPVVQVVPCGLTVTEDWTSAALLHFDDPTIAAVSPTLVKDKEKKRVTACGVDLTTGGGRKLVARGQAYNVGKLVQNKPLAAPLAGGFFRKSVLDALAGFDEAMHACASDLDFALCAKRLGLRTECEPTSVIVSDTSPVANDGSLSAGNSLERLYWRHRQQGKQASSIVPHYLRQCGELAYAVVKPRWLGHAVGRVAGRFGALLDRGLEARLQKAQERLAEEKSPRILQLPRKEVRPSDRRRAA